MRIAPQLMTYPDSLGGDLAALDTLLHGPLDGLFAGIHILPPFPSSGDRGFAPLTYGEIDPRFGTWADVTHLAQGHDVLLDLMINHLSRRSVEFEDFRKHGRRSPSADLFITVDKVWPNGDPPADEVADLPSQAGLAVLGGDDRGHRRDRAGWTSFGSRERSDRSTRRHVAAATRAAHRVATDPFAAAGSGSYTTPSAT